MWIATVVLCVQLAGVEHSSVHVGVLNDLLDGLVNTTRPDHTLYGGDVHTVVSLMSGLVKRSATGLLPVLDTNDALLLSTNISSVYILYY